MGKDTGVAECTHTGTLDLLDSHAVLSPTADVDAAQEPKTRKSRTNRPWTPAEELRLKQMRCWKQLSYAWRHWARLIRGYKRVYQMSQASTSAIDITSSQVDQ